MRHTTFFIERMDCPTEEQIIRNRLRSVGEIDALAFDLLQRELTVTHRLPDERVLLDAFSSVGMPAEVREPAQAEAGGTSAATTARRPLLRGREKLFLVLSGIGAVGSEVLAWAMGSDSSLPVVALALASIALGGRETLEKGWRALRTFTLSIDLLMIIAVTGAAIIGQWPEAAMVIFLFALAELIEKYALDRGRNAIRGLIELAPDEALVEQGGRWVEKRAASVHVGQRVRVKPGGRVPLDGTIVGGNSAVDQAPITGESIPVEKGVGDPLFAGTINGHGTLDFEVTANKGGTTLARIVRAVQQAQAAKAPTQRFVDRFARVYTPAVFVSALLVAVVPPLLFGLPFVEWLYRALVLLVIACPCALVISTPVTVVTGLAAAARRGILVKGGAYLEQGHRLRAIALDKTGTLTRGRPSVTDVIPLREGMSAREALHLAASLDALSEHPVASAIVAAWESIRAGDPEAEALLPVQAFGAIVGRGVKGTVMGRRYFVGNHRLAEEIGVCGPHVERALFGLEAEGKTAVVLATETEALAVLGVADTLREASVEAVRELQRLGIETVMLTGDNQTTAESIARQVGIRDVRGGLLPEDKLTAIDDLLRTHGIVGMVGDGINDAPALAKASVGFAMGAASTATALETADVALMQDDLQKLPAFILLSRRTGRILTQNIALSIGLKAIFFALALAGVATLWMAVFADMGATLLVAANGLRLRHESHH